MNGALVLSPWDQAPFFQPIRETYFPNMGSVIQVCDANPMRIALIFSANGSQTIRISTRSDLASDRGLLIINSGIPFALTHKDYGPLVQQQWWGVSSMAGGTLTVIEIMLAKWPGQT